MVNLDFRKMASQPTNGNEMVKQKKMILKAKKVAEDFIRSSDGTILLDNGILIEGLRDVDVSIDISTSTIARSDGSPEPIAVLRLTSGKHTVGIALLPYHEYVVMSHTKPPINNAIAIVKKPFYYYG